MSFMARTTVKNYTHLLDFCCEFHTLHSKYWVCSTFFQNAILCQNLYFLCSILVVSFIYTPSTSVFKSLPKCHSVLKSVFSLLNSSCQFHLHSKHWCIQISSKMPFCAKICIFFAQFLLSVSYTTLQVLGVLNFLPKCHSVIKSVFLLLNSCCDFHTLHSKYLVCSTFFQNAIL